MKFKIATTMLAVSSLLVAPAFSEEKGEAAVAKEASAESAMIAYVVVAEGGG